MTNLNVTNLNVTFFLSQIIDGLRRLPEQIRAVLGQETAVKELAEVED
jgi:hypothetical protein